MAISHRTRQDRGLGKMEAVREIEENAPGGLTGSTRRAHRWLVSLVAVLSGWVCAPGGRIGCSGCVYAWPSAGGLVSHDGAAVQDFTAPDATGFASVQR